jgi:hypothetical protein
VRPHTEDPVPQRAGFFVSAAQRATVARGFDLAAGLMPHSRQHEIERTGCF